MIRKLISRVFGRKKSTASGEPAVIASLPQRGLSLEDAEHTIALLNQRDAKAGRPDPRNV